MIKEINNQIEFIKGISTLFFNHLAHQENKCVIIVTHSKNVVNLVDVVYDLKKGKVINQKSK